jgi:mono/diheme cytochrome c family protein
MSTRVLSSLALAAVVALTSTMALAQQRSGADLGKREYESNCASCHGMTGKGDGPLKPYLTRAAPDLTTIAKANGGALPVSRLYQVIEGSTDVAAHGGRDMPVWGRDYRLKAGEYYFDVPYDPDVYVRVRIMGLIDYIARLQAK